MRCTCLHVGLEIILSSDNIVASNIVVKDYIVGLKIELSFEFTSVDDLLLQVETEARMACHLYIYFFL